MLGLLRCFGSPALRWSTTKEWDQMKRSKFSEEQVAVPGWLCSVAGQRPVRAVVSDELLELGEQGHLCHSFPLRPTRVHGVGEADCRQRGGGLHASGLQSGQAFLKRVIRIMRD